ncbi:MAG: DUF1641 domain-containing protein [Deinococcales bacterium]
MANETVFPLEQDLGTKLDAVLAKLEDIERRMGALEQAGPSAELSQPIALALSGMTDEMVTGLVGKLSSLAEVILDPGVLTVLDRLKSPEVQQTLTRLTDASTLEALDGLTGALNLVQSGLTDDMVAGLVRKVGVLGELILDPFVLDALERLARALKAGQSEYPAVTVPPVGGIFGALRSANDPDTRRVMAFALAVMRNLGQEFSGPGRS